MGLTPRPEPSRRDEWWEQCWVGVITLAAVAAMACYQASSSDLGFHLATGRAILAQGGLPATNVLSFTEPDHPWLLHQWLPALLFELIWQRAGVTGVILLKMGIVVLTWLVVLATALRLGAAPRLAGVAVLVAAAAASFRFSERPLLFTNLALAVVGWLLVRAALAEVARQGQPPGGVARWRDRSGGWLVGALLVTAAAFHLHAGAIFSVILLVSVVGGLLAEGWRSRWPWLGRDAARPVAGLRPALAVLLVAVAALALAAGSLALYHPWGIKVCGVPFQMGEDRYLADHLTEFRPPWRFPFSWIWPAWFLLGLLVVGVAPWVRRTHATLLLVVVPFVVLGLKYVRFLDLLGIVAAPVLAVGLSQWAARDAVRRVAPSLATAALAILALTGPLDTWSRFPPGFGLNPAVWPLGLFGTLQREGLRGPAYVSDGWTGPFIGLFYPQERSFFDARIEAFSPEFIREVYMAIRYGQPGWDEQLDRYGIQLVLLKYTTPAERQFQGGRENLRQLLARDPRWALVDFDDHGELFLRRGGVNGSQAERLAIPGFDPDRLQFVGPPGASFPALERLLRSTDPLARPTRRRLVATALSAAATGRTRLTEELLAAAGPDDPDGPQLIPYARHLLAAPRRAAPEQTP